ncbi:hypothetical protein N7467_000111 [Penicillium canescens]|nr:hypothetical protein N7467_000111 [Penicillium canescens]
MMRRGLGGSSPELLLYLIGLADLLGFNVAVYIIPARLSRPVLLFGLNTTRIPVLLHFEVGTNTSCPSLIFIMPGVPSSGGCGACRKAKKKRDQLKPVCSRCGELHVTDIRYALVYYGPSFRDIPRRLGSSPVLDSAVKAISAAYPFLHTGCYSPTALARYGQSLRALRECLNDAAEIRTPNTSFAVYLITICQRWLGRYGDSLTGHSEAISHLLKAAPLHEWNSRFEAEMVVTMSETRLIKQILEGIFNPRIKKDPAFWELASSFKQRIFSSHENRGKSSMEYQHLAMLPDFVQNPDVNLPEIENGYLRLKNDAQIIRQRLNQSEELPPMSFSSPAAVVHSHAQAAYAMTSTLTVLTNSLLRIFKPYNVVLVSECILLCDEMMTQAELATYYWPLGSDYMPLCLTVAWAALKGEPRLIPREGEISDAACIYKDIK